LNYDYYCTVKREYVTDLCLLLS